MPLDETISPGQTGHITDHQTMAIQLNLLGSGTTATLAVHIPAANITRAQDGTVASFSTAMAQAIVVPTGDVVRVHVNLDWSSSTVADVAFVITRAGVELRRVTETASDINHLRVCSLSFLDLTPGAGASVTYEVKTIAGGGTTTVRSDGTTKGTSSLELETIAQ